MLKKILYDFLNHSNRGSTLNKDELANATMLIEASGSILPKMIFMFASLFMLNFFLFFTGTSMVLFVLH